MRKKAKIDPFPFKGKVNNAGYEWVRGKDGKTRLVPRPAMDGGWHVYEPEPGLFIKFAQVSFTKEAIENFAGSHGDLFNRYEAHQNVVNGGRVLFGASFDTWKQEIGDLQTLIQLWNTIRQRQISLLKEFIKWTRVKGQNTKFVEYSLKTPKHKSVVILAHGDINPSELDRFDEKDPLPPARCALQREINLRLAEQPPIPQITWASDGSQRMTFVPPNLLAAIWLQFAQAVTDKHEVKMCVICGKPFPIGSGAFRSDKDTCGNACKQEKWRNEHKDE